MMKIYIFGANGYLGSHFAEYYQKQGDTVFTDRVDIRDYSAVLRALEKTKPDIVINAAGKTGTPNVDWCESNKAETALVNINGALNIAGVCDLLGIYMVHIGSGCIYAGHGGSGNGFTEEEPANFGGSYYSRTKAVSETMLEEFNILQLRVRIPIEGKSYRKNVIDKLKNYDRVVSIENSFTVVEDFIPASAELIRRKERGIFNMTNVGSMDHKFLMELYRDIVDPERTFDYMTEAELNAITKAPRSNCTLDVTKRENLGIHMPEIKERMPEILEAYKRNQ